ncbi:MAG TPA: PilZ domain-containing protein [Anaeromyxobacteraceae bacterium]|jgi:hypothetical protein|nr:PilZ domain-containing protein [Anaeromyxobacteraceae bacterium]
MFGLPSSLRVLVVGADPELTAAFHLHLSRAGHAVYAVPAASELDVFLRAAAPHLVALLLPATPDASWGGALTTAASAARVGVRIVLVAPSREVVEPLAAVAGAERAWSRAELLARPLALLDGGGAPRPGPRFPPPAAPVPAPLAAAVPTPVPPPPAAPPPPAGAAPWEPGALTLDEPGAPLPQRPAARRAVDLSALIDEELVDEPRNRPRVTRVEVNVSLVSDHNFYVGTTRRVDSGGVFIATQLPPPVGTRLQVRLGLADGRKLELDGEVTFIRERGATTGRQPAGCGVRLVGLPGWAAEAIDRFTLARQPIFMGGS